MKRRFLLYCLLWLAATALFHIIVFTASAPTVNEEQKASFWLAYLFILLALLGQLGCGYLVLIKENGGRFSGWPVWSFSCTGLASVAIAGAACMLIPKTPVWISIAICSAVMIVGVLELAVAGTAGTLLSDGESTVKAACFQSLSADIQALLEKPMSDEMRKNIEKVIEAVQREQIVSAGNCSAVESQLTVGLSVLCKAVSENESEAVFSACENLIVLIRRKTQIASRNQGTGKT